MKVIVNTESIYKRDSKEAIRVWFGEVGVDGDTYGWRSTAGLLDGKKVTSGWKIVEQKNVGKANETSLEEQALSEMNSDYDKKLERGYFKTIADIDKFTKIKPMLAAKYEDVTINFETQRYYTQPKLDGMRGLGNDGKLISRANKEIITLKHIQSDLEGIEDYIDGELYAHGLTFQENMKIIKKYREGQTENVKYHVYDMISDKPFIERYFDLITIVEYKPNIEVVPLVEINNPEELEAYYGKFMSEGYEGIMIRWGTDGYKVNGRSDNLLKYKKFFDVAVPIVDITPNDAIPTHGTIWIEYNGKVVKTGARLSHEEREDILTNKEEYIGKTAEVRYFETTDDGSLRFPVFCGIRLDK